jgi:hypothetical protein
MSGKYLYYNFFLLNYNVANETEKILEESGEIIKLEENISFFYDIEKRENLDDIILEKEPLKLKWLYICIVIIVLIIIIGLVLFFIRKSSKNEDESEDESEDKKSVLSEESEEGSEDESEDKKSVLSEESEEGSEDESVLKEKPEKKAEKERKLAEKAEKKAEKKKDTQYILSLITGNNKNTKDKIIVDLILKIYQMSFLKTSKNKNEKEQIENEKEEGKNKEEQTENKEEKTKNKNQNETKRINEETKIINDKTKRINNETKRINEEQLKNKKETTCLIDSINTFYKEVKQDTNIINILSSYKFINIKDLKNIISLITKFYKEVSGDEKIIKIVLGFLKINENEVNKVNEFINLIIQLSQQVNKKKEITMFVLNEKESINEVKSLINSINSLYISLSKIKKITSFILDIVIDFQKNEFELTCSDIIILLDLFASIINNIKNENNTMFFFACNALKLKTNSFLNDTKKDLKEYTIQRKSFIKFLITTERLLKINNDSFADEIKSFFSIVISPQIRSLVEKTIKLISKNKTHVQKLIDLTPLIQVGGIIKKEEDKKKKENKKTNKTEIYSIENIALMDKRSEELIKYLGNINIDNITTVYNSLKGNNSQSNESTTEYIKTQSDNLYNEISKILTKNRNNE